jgi:hypothetical protein
MAKKRLSRELKPTEVPPDSDESLPEALTLARPRPSTKPAAGGAEHRSGVAHDDEPEPPGRGPEREDPPRGKQPSGA